MSYINKEILINVSTKETRVAIVEEDKLVEMFIERPENERTIGNIYAGYVDNILDGMNSIFVVLGDVPNGFSHLGDFKNDLLPPEILSGKYSFQSIDEDIVLIDNQDLAKKKLKKKDKVLVQVIKESIGSKGPRITSNVTIPGRYVVLIPNDRGVKISKKITNPSIRRKLNKIVKNLIPDNFGVIVRTAAENKDSQAFTNDIIHTYNIWKKVVKEYKKAELPTLLYKDDDLAASIVRDLFNEDVSRMIVDSEDLFNDIQEYIRNNAPELEDNLFLHDGGEPIFDKYHNISKDYYKSLAREVFMKNGGSIVIDHTEALVAIDVNSKRYIKKRSHEENSYNINLAAAREISRQLRLRDMGGLVIIDFIDMHDNDNKAKIFNEMKNLLKLDKAKSSIEPISRFGLIEMTRQRLKPSIVQTVFENCPTCSGKGIVQSKESISIQLDRWLKNYKFVTNNTEVDIAVNKELKRYFENAENNIIQEMMIKNWMKINFIINNSLNLYDFKCYESGTDKEITREFAN
ncbi:MAG: Rne/Rng family ribonuclease [Candidatus Delongbacteria bacterium]|jgi:ribonuclease G|nr:Rne/Rng family ribonuclease [Candidatus Delongbacteria bacterium]